MPSHLRNACTIISPKKNSKSKRTYLFIEKTGYANIWIGSQHIYWNYNVSQTNPDKVDFNSMAEQQQPKKKKQVILVRRR